MQKLVLKRRALITLLEHNGFELLPGRGGSHDRYRGRIRGRVCHVDVDQTIDDFKPESHGVLYHIVMYQLGFLSEKGATLKSAWARFYGGEPSCAKRAQTPYKRWDDAG